VGVGLGEVEVGGHGRSVSVRGVCRWREGL
jgi:hypothetical protein